MSALRIAFIGCGSIAFGHLDRLLETGEAEVVAVCDTVEEKTRPFVEKVKQASGEVPAIYSDYHSLLDHAQADAVYVLTPHSLHAQQVVDSLSRGAHVLVEKPMVTSPSEAREVIRKWREAGKVVLVSYNFRYTPACQYAQKLIQSQELGQVEFIGALLCQDWVARITETRRVWRFNPKLSGGGILMDSGSHLIDAILFVTGLQPIEVFAFTEMKDKPVDLFAAVSVRYANGALGSISTVGNAAWKWQLGIWLSGGAILLEDSKLLVGKGVGGRYEFREVPESEMPPASDPDRNFLNAILRGEEPLAGPEAGLRVALFTEAIYRSASMRERVCL